MTAGPESRVDATAGAPHCHVPAAFDPEQHRALEHHLRRLAGAAEWLEQVASPDVVYIGLDVDPNERDADLAEYARREGFSWRFVVASPEMSRSLAATFGDQILSLPATPLVVLGPDGELIEMDRRSPTPSPTFDDGTSSTPPITKS